jgi:hypothetical protein
MTKTKALYLEVSECMTKKEKVEESRMNNGWKNA